MLNLRNIVRLPRSISQMNNLIDDCITRPTKRHKEKNHTEQEGETDDIEGARVCKLLNSFHSLYVRFNFFIIITILK